MKKLFILLALTIGLVSFANGQATFPNGIVVGSGGSTVEIDSIVEIDGKIIFYAGSTALEPRFTDTAALETIVTLQSDTLPLFVFGGGLGNAADSISFSDSTLYGSFFNKGSDSLIITELRAVMVAGVTPLGTDTLSVQVSWDDTLRGVIVTNLNAAALPVTSTTTGTVDASFANATIPPNKWVWCTTPGVLLGRKPSALIVTLSGHKINRRY